MNSNRLLSDSSLRDEASYRRRLNILFEDIGAFIDQLEKSGRNVVVVMIPEHGAALRGDLCLQLPPDVLRHGGLAGAGLPVNQDVARP